MHAIDVVGKPASFGSIQQQMAKLTVDFDKAQRKAARVCVCVCVCVTQSEPLVLLAIATATRAQTRQHMCTHNKHTQGQRSMSEPTPQRDAAALHAHGQHAQTLPVLLRRRPHKIRARRCANKQSFGVNARNIAKHNACERVSAVTRAAEQRLQLTWLGAALYSARVFRQNTRLWSFFDL